jgi:predicted ABC-type ATPase
LPYLTIIAGPNGAGKSTTSKLLLLDRGITAFDFDKEFYDEWERFSSDPILENRIREFTTNKFLELRQKALIDKANFSYETNLNTLEVIKTLNE